MVSADAHCMVLEQYLSTATPAEEKSVMFPVRTLSDAERHDKPLPEAVSPKVTRWRAPLNAYIFKLIHVSGKNNCPSEDFKSSSFQYWLGMFQRFWEVVHMLSEVDQKIERLKDVDRSWTEKDPLCG
ncbi:hypothetical protein SK128_017808 [Halocaridina rubra]|uniref:Uncharacterized protein n=1 Tax=Halocaridina rubra TaxID=373956 RepID=A0AAN8X9G8_HALRR